MAMADIRNDSPIEDIKKFKEVLLYVLSKIGAKANIGKTALVKILYFIDFNYYEEKETQLMGMKYIKQQYGPYPLLFDKIINDMKANKELDEFESFYGVYPQVKYFPCREADLKCLSGEELEYINKTIKKYSDQTAKELEELSHRDIPWISAKYKDVLQYEGVFYRTPETSVRDYSEIPD